MPVTVPARSVKLLTVRAAVVRLLPWSPGSSPARWSTTTQPGTQCVAHLSTHSATHLRMGQRFWWAVPGRQPEAEEWITVRRRHWQAGIGTAAVVLAAATAGTLAAHSPAWATGITTAIAVASAAVGLRRAVSAPGHRREE
jgi:hypothetical protein